MICENFIEIGLIGPNLYAGPEITNALKVKNLKNRKKCNNSRTSTAITTKTHSSNI